MARLISPSEILRSAATAGIIPPTAEVDRKGRATWRAGDFDLATMVLKRPDGGLAWHTFVGDAKLGPAMHKYGSLAVRIDPAGENSRRWPSGSSPSDEDYEFLKEGVGQAPHFVKSREDLGSILASDADIQRGELKTWLPRPSYPARLIQALIIARDAGSASLEESVRLKLKSGPLILADRREIDVMSAAKAWAKEYSKALGVTIPV